MKADNFNEALDDCLDRLNKGEKIEQCLKDYPTFAGELEPLLRTMLETRAAYAFTPSPDAKRLARQKFYATLEQTHRPSLFARLASNRMLVTAAVVAIVAIVSLVSLRPGTQPPPAVVSNPQGNFVFLISDEPNAIGDFENLLVTISSIGIQKSSENWLEFEPHLNTVDLTQLQGEASQQVWRGDLAQGQYSQVFIYVSRVTGKLKATGQTIEIKLPSGKLHLSQPFEIKPGVVTSFTYDITVIGAGNSGKYLLKPQFGQVDTRTTGTVTPASPTPASPTATLTASTIQGLVQIDTPLQAMLTSMLRGSVAQW